MDERKEKIRLQSAVNTTLSGLQGDPWLAQRVMAEAKGEVKVKKKISVGLVLTLVLVLAVVTALAAITLNAYYEKTIEKEGQSGMIQDWSASDKVALVDWMVEVGIELDEEQVAKLHESGLSDADKGTLAMEIIGSYYPARDGILTSVDIIAKEKGPIEYWTLEDKAWLSAMMAKYQPEEVSSVNLLPTEGDITKEQAVEIMYAYYEKEYGLKREDFDESKMAISFSEGTWDDGSGPERLKTWSMDLWLKGDPNPMGISILPDGTIKQASGPYIRDWRDDWYETYMSNDYWTIEGMVAFQESWEPRIEDIKKTTDRIDDDLLYLLTKDFKLPESGDISQDKAVELANAAILNYMSWSDNMLEYYQIRRAYLLGDTQQPYYFFWYVPSSKTRDLTKDERKNYIPIVLHMDASNGAITQIIPLTDNRIKLQDII